ncbi:hypothetical protein MBLNU457_g0313t1 [Dothideomycetes sp. NU457]
MPELRKRKTPPPAPPKPAKKERKQPAEKSTATGTIATKAKESAKNEEPPAPTAPEPAPAAARDTEPAQDIKNKKPTSKSGPPKVGDKIDFDNFGGAIETNDGASTTLQSLVSKSKAGVVLFTYPKASTPGCTTQVCLFRDSYEPLTATGLDIYGLSRDSPKSNSTFKTKQNLPYPLLCDRAASLIAAIGFKNGDKTQRGVFVVTKDGEVLAAEAGGPAATVEVVKGIVEKMGGVGEKGDEKLEKAEVRATAAEGDEVEAK